MGRTPHACLALSGKTLYGTTYVGGTYGQGTVFKINTDGSGFAVLKHFLNNEGVYPNAGVVVTDSTVYGTTTYGGAFWRGTVFKLNPDGSGFAVLKHFNGIEGAAPQSDLLLSGSKLYGTTSWGGQVGSGTVFEINTDGSGFNVLKHFTGSDGSYAYGGLALSDSTLCGTANSGGNQDSGVLFSLSLLPGVPQVQLQPQSQHAQLGWTINFKSIAGGIPTPACQWYFNETNAIASGTNGLLQISDVQHSHAGNYTAVFSNDHGSVTSVVARLEVDDPFISEEPLGQVALAGKAGELHVNAGGTAPLSYQWFKAGVPLADDGRMFGVNTSTLTFTNLIGSDGGLYAVVVSNTSGSVTSSPMLFVVQDPFVSDQPRNQFVNAGETALFTVTGGGTPPLSYQWLKDGFGLSDGPRISGAQTATLFLSNAVGSDAGSYSVVVSNEFGVVTSDAAQLSVNLATLDNFNPGSDSGIKCLALQVDGKILAGGWFESIGGLTRQRLARLNSDGTVDLGFNPTADNEVDTLAVQADGKILAGGWFHTIAGTTNRYLTRLNLDGSLDTTFHFVADSDVRCLAVQPDGKILVGGDFATVNGGTNQYLVRLNVDGTLDPGFQGWADGSVTCIALQSDGKILVGGWFGQLNGQPRNGLGRLNGDGTLENSFNPGADNGVSTLVVQPDGRILLGGSFMTIGGSSRRHIARLNPDGTVDANFISSADSDVHSIVLQTDGRLLVGGWFSRLAGQPRYQLGRLNPDGTLDPSFCPAVDGGYSSIYTLALQPDGKILIGGWFETLAGQSRHNLARLNNTVPATETLSFDGDSVTWWRGGSSPEIWRSSFELSTNGTDWVTLGFGVPGVGGWQLPGVSFQTNGTMRAVGFVATAGIASWFVDASVGSPAIVVPPESISRHLGGLARFTVQAAGSPPLAYQWCKAGAFLSDGGTVLGAQTPMLTLSSVVGADAGSYTVIVSNSFGSITSVVVSLNVEDPFITSQPTSLGVNQGAVASFSVVAGGTTPLSYQWLRAGLELSDGGNLFGSQTPALMLTNVSGANAGEYSVVVRNSSGSVTSLVASLTVNDPFIGTQPVSRSVHIGQTAVFSVGAAGSQPLGVQWRKDGVNLSDNGRVSGVNTATLTIGFALPADLGGYSAVVFNQYGSLTSLVATLSVRQEYLVNGNFEAGNNGFACGYIYWPGWLYGEGYFDVVSNPHLDNVNGASFGDHTTGSGLMLALNASPNLNTLVWGQTVDVMPGCTYSFSGWGATWGTTGQTPDPSPPVLRLVINGQLQGNDIVLNSLVGQWHNFARSWNSGSATQAVIQIYDMNISRGGNDFALDDLEFVPSGLIPPTVSVSPGSQTAEIGTVVQLKGVVTGSPAPIAQWYHNGSTLSGGTNHILRLSHVLAADAGAYTLAVWNIAGATSSAPAALSVVSPVECRSVPALGLRGDVGAVLRIEQTDALGSLPNWSLLDTMSLTSTAEWYFDLTLPLPPLRFYRASQSAPVGIAPGLEANMIPALTLTGNPGDQIRVDGINQIGPTDAWFTLDTVTLTNTSQLYFDVTAPGQPARLYRVVPVP